jgi:hypothetical protein
VLDNGKTRNDLLNDLLYEENGGGGSMEKSNISWTDGTWNPWYGCDQVGPECQNCYIEMVLE